jgi:LysR family transcriptional regulator, benzoate and cis,cis-muconate-responsive activator of ben and cat genes
MSMDLQDKNQARVGQIGLRRLRYFLAVAEELHFGRAAERLGIAQPALSRQIAVLEEVIGALLFDRVRSKIFLTKAGEVLVPQARDILLRTAEAARSARAAAQGAVGAFAIGFVGSATYSVLPGLVQKFRETHPAVDLTLNAMNNAELRRALIDRGIDVAFARSGLDDGEFASEIVLVEPLVVVLPQSSPLAQRSTIALADLADDSFILYPRHPRPSFADDIIGLCRTAGFTPMVAQETMDLQTAMALVSVGAGLSIVPASVEQSHRHGVLYANLEGSDATTTLFMVWRRDNRSPLLENFRNVVRSNKRSFLEIEDATRSLRV